MITSHKRLVTIHSSSGAVHYRTTRNVDGALPVLGKVKGGTLGFAFHNSPAFLAASFPHWLLVSLIAVVATLPWLRWRFSLRTLLVAITLVALVLGIIIATTR